MGIRHGMSVEETSLFYAANIRDNVVLLSVWILPFLSGLLGATVFLLRDSLSPMTGSFDLARVFVRLHWAALQESSSAGSGCHQAPWASISVKAHRYRWPWLFSQDSALTFCFLRWIDSGQRSARRKNRERQGQSKIYTR